jgi:hypothetical protein
MSKVWLACTGSVHPTEKSDSLCLLVDLNIDIGDYLVGADIEPLLFTTGDHIAANPPRRAISVQSLVPSPAEGENRCGSGLGWNCTICFQRVNDLSQCGLALQGVE